MRCQPLRRALVAQTREIFMNEIDILKKLTSNLTERKSTAALSNYEVLCNNILFSHELLGKGLSYLNIIVSDLKLILSNNSALHNEYKCGSDLYSFALIVPVLLRNDIEVISKLFYLTSPDDRRGIDFNNVGSLHKGFVDYNNLVTATRQFIDSLVTDAYQLQMLKPKEFNYHVLLSLNSFEKYATKSIRQGLFNDEVESSLREFRKLGFHEWKNSNITHCQHTSFSNKVDYLFSELSRFSPDDASYKIEIKNLFNFSSEFTHIGYISTFFTSQAGAQPIFGSDQGPYLLSTENFSELKYQILESCIRFIFLIYVPVLKKCIEKMILNEYSISIIKSLSNLILLLENGIKTRNNKYYFFVCDSLIGSSKEICLPCVCGHLNYWKPPHNNSDLFCTGCGSSYNILSVDGDPGYIITSNGPVKVIGSTAPDFHDLPLNEQQGILDKIAEFRAKGN